MNVHGSVQGEGVHTVGANFLIIEINQSETTKSHTFDMLLKLTNHK